jgi:hypothetical protein
VPGLRPAYPDIARKPTGLTTRAADRWVDSLDLRRHAVGAGLLRRQVEMVNNRTLHITTAEHAARRAMRAEDPEYRL